MCFNQEGSREPMSAVENPKPFICPYADNRCTEFACVYNKIFVPSQSGAGVFGVPIPKCPFLKSVIRAAMLDETIDIAHRIWMEDVFIKEKFRFPPPELAKLFD